MHFLLLFCLFFSSSVFAAGIETSISETDEGGINIIVKESIRPATTKAAPLFEFVKSLKDNMRFEDDEENFSFQCGIIEASSTEIDTTCEINLKTPKGKKVTGKIYSTLTIINISYTPALAFYDFLKVKPGYDTLDRNFGNKFILRGSFTGIQIQVR